MDKLRFTGDQSETVIREVTFKRGRAKAVKDPDLFAKLSVLPHFEIVKSDDENSD